MITQTPAIVISSLKYGDTSKIIKCYTKSSGIKSFIARGVYSKKNKKNPLFSPLNQVDLIFNVKNSKSLDVLHEAGQSVYYQSIYLLPQKSAMALFLSEILNSVLQEEEPSPSLFEFIRLSLKYFDEKKDAYSDFHLWFLLNLSKHLGFYPNLKPEFPIFDLQNGISSDLPLSEYFLSGNELSCFEALISLDFFSQTENQFNQKQRKSILAILLEYYSLHISGFRKPKSLDVLAVIFG